MSCDAPTHLIPWGYKFNVNAAFTWRQRLGNRLRILADRLDGRKSLALDIQTSPPVPVMEIAGCVRLGLDHARSLLIDAVQNSAAEHAMHALAPELWEGDQ